MARRTGCGGPFLKWAGGKTGLLKHYMPFFPTDFTGRRYFEPFLGGGAVFFYLRSRLLPQSIVLSDINDDLINAYLQVRDAPERVVELLMADRELHDHEYYYRVRGLDPSDLSPLERAVRFIYLNRTCYNGLWRVNGSGQFNVPMGRYKDPLGRMTGTIRAASRQLKDVRIEIGPYQNVLIEAAPGDFVYFDPPYHPLSPTSSFTSYSRHSFGEDDQRHLAGVFAELAERGVLVMLSNSDTPFVRSLYSEAEYRVESIRAPRAINSKASKRGAVGELLIMTRNLVT